MSEETKKNADREIWRAVEEDYYSPSIHVTEVGSIGINVAGKVIVMSVEKWHQLQADLEKHRWIPVSEKLPKHGCSILACGKDGYGYEICAVVSYNLEFNKFRVLTDVTHWKPIALPESEVK